MLILFNQRVIYEYLKNLNKTRVNNDESHESEETTATAKIAFTQNPTGDVERNHSHQALCCRFFCSLYFLHHSHEAMLRAREVSFVFLPITLPHKSKYPSKP